MTAGQGFREAAQALGRLGYQVFPVHTRDKKPPLTEHGHRDASTDPKTITKWWTDNPDANIAVACAASGVVAIDIDPRHGGDERFAALLEQLGKLPETVEVATGGGGRHLLFAAPRDAEFRGNLGHGIDIKSEGYVMAPPSIHPSGGTYRWIRSAQDQKLADLPPDWLKAMVKTAAPSASRLRALSTNTVGCTSYGQAALDAELAAIRTAPEGTRNDTTNKSAFKLAGLHAGGEIRDCREDLTIAAMYAGLSESEASKTVESGWRAGLKEPRTRPTREESHNDRQPVATRSLPRGTIVEASGQGHDTICLSEVEPRPADWIWLGRLAAGEMTVLTGAPGVGKGLLLCYIASCFTCGKPMFGDRKAKPAGHLLWISVEDAHDSALVPRLMAAGADRSRVHAWDMDRPLSLPEDTDRVIGAVDEHQCGIVFIDPAPTLLDREHSSNNDADVRRSFSRLAAACRERGCALVLVRHTNKRQMGNAMDRGGGSIGWTGMARIELMLGRRPVEPGATTVDVTADVVTLAPVKSNLGSRPASLNMKIIPVGEAARIEVIGETDSTADDLCAPERPRTARKANTAEELLREALGDGRFHRQREIEEKSRGASISKKTLSRAKKKLGVISQQRADGWWWQLPPTKPDHGACVPVTLWPSDDDDHLPSSSYQYLEESDGHRATGTDSSPRVPLPTPGGPTRNREDGL